MKTLIVNADDFGLTTATCAAILRLADKQAVSSTSVLILAPATERWAEAAQASGLGIGVHLACVGEDPPLLTASEIPTLVDRDGRLPVSWRELVAGLVRRRIDPADVEREFRAQIGAAHRWGLSLDHLNTHQHVHLWPSIGQIVQRLAIEAGAFGIRRPQAARWNLAGLGVRCLGFIGKRRAPVPPLVSTERFAGLDEAGGWTAGTLESVLARWGTEPIGSAEIGCHPGAHTDPERDRYRWGYGWGVEADALGAVMRAPMLERAGFTLGTYRDLAG